MQSMRYTTVLLALLLIGCGTGIRSKAPFLSHPRAGIETAPTVTASPNPVPIRSGMGKTTITWDTGGRGIGQVYAARDNLPEELFAEGGDGSKDAAWIDRGSTYAFRLYAGRDHTDLLATVTVTGASPTDQ